MEHMLQDRLETVQLLARFKLSVRRHLQIAVDLQLLESDRQYAERVLATIEAAAEDEQLLILTLQVRDSVLRPAPMANAAQRAAEPAEPPQAPPAGSATRSYVFGVRGW